jgi:biopolymer transport protein TolR
MRTNRRAMAEINVVPYIDVMLVLLVIFMITTPLLTQGVKVNLPQAKSKQISAVSQQPIVVSVDAKGKYYLNIANDPKKPLLANALMTRVAAELALAKRSGKGKEVYVKGDKAVDYGKVMHAMVLLQNAGAKEVGLLTQPLERG